MANYVWVIPSIHKPYTDECLSTLKIPKDNVLVVDNTKENKGVAGSWNLGIDRMIDWDADWLVICSAAMRFGNYGGQDFIDKLKDDEIATEAGNDIGWHLIAFHRKTIETVGYFDETFYPAYSEDNDYSWRIQKAYGLTKKDYPLWPKVDVDATLTEVAHGIGRGGVRVSLEEMENKFIAKWGGRSGSEKFDRPYNDPLLNYRYAERKKVW